MKKNIILFVFIEFSLLTFMVYGTISNTHFSDLIRLNLLNQYGGTWIDSTCLQTEKIPDYIKNSNLFLYKFIS